MKMKTSTKKLALLGILGAQALALSFLEGLLPPFPFLPPGAKPGFANIITMFTLCTLGLPEALYITAMKAVFAGVTRGFTAFLMSLAGGLLSTLAMRILLKTAKRKNGFGWVGISVVCALCHNAGQLAVAVFWSGTPRIAALAPLLLLFAVATGTVTGAVLRAVISVLQKQAKYFTG